MEVKDVEAPKAVVKVHEAGTESRAVKRVAVVALAIRRRVLSVTHNWPRQLLMASAAQAGENKTTHKTRQGRRGSSSSSRRNVERCQAHNTQQSKVGQRRKVRIAFCTLSDKMQDPNEDTEWNDILRAKGIIPEKPKEKEVTEDDLVHMIEDSIKEKTGGEVA